MSCNSPKNSVDCGFDDLRPKIEQALQEACEFGSGCPPRLSEAMSYALLAPGKRLRPALVMMAAECCGGSVDAVIPAAVAVEMIHAYSLIHDDLPAMDDDDLRRGRPTVHIKFDEATAILAGDALLTEAFHHLSKHIKSPEKAIAAVRSLSVAAGASRLVGGQADDLAAERTPSLAEPNRPRIAGCQEETVLADEPSVDPRLAHLESIHRRKTGALFSVSLDLGAILVDANSEQRDLLGSYAAAIGLAFQVVDDLLDYTAEASTLGKKTGKDAARGKLTYPGVMGLEQAQRKAQELIASARGGAEKFGDSGRRLRLLADFVLERSH
ncbi:polyprenyl synthetase family protein [bacterium]|nr:polyprenyl synthetase family protein [bacterium]MDB4500444.1 polyprenyl synthetase family protein [bacterium]